MIPAEFEVSAYRSCRCDGLTEAYYVSVSRVSY
jgi:hypothetical protein